MVVRRVKPARRQHDVFRDKVIGGELPHFLGTEVHGNAPVRQGRPNDRIEDEGSIPNEIVVQA